MDYKEKLKEALNSDNTDYEVVRWIEQNFPELKEPEDELTWLKKFIKEEIDCLSIDIRDSEDRVKLKNFQRSIAWLEKQKTSEEALQYLRENHSSSEMSDFQAAMNIAVAKAYDKGYNDGLEKQGEQKPAEWNRDDRKHIEKLIPIVDTSQYKEEVEWLVSLLERTIPQPQQEWSKEDKKLINDTCYLINTLASGYGEKVTEPISFTGVQQINSIKTRLRALVDSRPQNTWKPSDLQIKALEYYTKIGCVDKEEIFGSELVKLLEELKKL